MLLFLFPHCNDEIVTASDIIGLVYLSIYIFTNMDIYNIYNIWGSKIHVKQVVKQNWVVFDVSKVDIFYLYYNFQRRGWMIKEKQSVYF